MAVSATRAGAALIPFSAGVVIGATLAGRYVARIGYRRQIFAGGVLFAGAVLLLSGLDPGVSYARITFYTVLCGLGAGPSMPLFTLAAQNAVDVRMVGQATSASQFFRQIGATVGAAVLGTVLVTTLSLAFTAMDLPPGVLTGMASDPEQLVATGGAALPESIRERYAERAAAAATPVEAESLRAEGEAVATRVAAGVAEAFSRATSRIYWMTAFIIVLATLLTLRIPGLELRTTHDREVVHLGG